MKAKVKIEKEVEIRSVLIEIAPRHIGDSDDDDMRTDFPLLNDAKTMWRASVNIDTGEIDNWPIGDARQMHVKVCDAGRYSLIDDGGNVIAVRDGYVPHGVVPGEYGDYIKLSINEQGVITNWPKRPRISEFFEDEG